MSKTIVSMMLFALILCSCELGNIGGTSNKQKQIIPDGIYDGFSQMNSAASQPITVFIKKQVILIETKPNGGAYLSGNLIDNAISTDADIRSSKGCILVNNNIKNMNYVGCVWSKSEEGLMEFNARIETNASGQVISQGVITFGEKKYDD